MSINNLSKYILKPTIGRKFITHLNKSGVLLPVILLETTVTGGRTYQAYKRGGAPEARERICEESIGAVFWLGGVKAFNALGDKIGQKFFNIENPKFSLAKDAVRHPFENLVRDKKLENAKKFLIGFKFTKVAFSVIAAAGILGFVVPKLNQMVTRHILKTKKDDKINKQSEQKVDKASSKNKFGFPFVSIDGFIKKSVSSKPSFGKFSIDKFATLTNNLENHDIYKLLATDTGVLTGRTYNARNKDERIEILFRDGASIYFYLRCKDDVIKLLRKMDGFGGKLSKLDPYTAMNVHNTLVKQLVRHVKSGETKIDAENVRKLILGSDPQKVENILSRFEFKKGDIIALEDFIDAAKKAGLEADENTLNKLYKKAQSMSKLQPERMRADIGHLTVGNILTKQQVRDVLSDSIVSRPTFLKKVMKKSFDGSLVDPYKFVSRESVETFRNNIDDYVKSILEYIEKNNINEITPDIMVKINKMNFAKNALHIVAGLGVSALFLSTIIPKVQYLITKLRTGSSAFPGIKDIK